MKTPKVFLPVLIALSITLGEVYAQTPKSLQTVFTNLNAEQLKLARDNKFTKAEVVSLEKVMAASGNKLIGVIKNSADETPQFLIDQIESEFKNLNAENAKIIAGARLAAWTNLTNTSKTKLVRKLQSDYLGASKLVRTEILTDLRAGIQVSLIKGFGGDEWQLRGK
ncbi:MAG: hypothetical protein A2X22_06935 [Bacteroidetes bacterium GWF2_49_14]|nr:MAG: hypothetical protein A2X22_06935 [Bacteroidetes bacterium GWF2_49_14]